MGDSLVEDDKLDEARRLMAKAEAAGKRLILPVDVVVARSSPPTPSGTITTPDAIPEGWRILDIGPQTILAFGEALADAQTIIWNGTLGVAEFPAFALGTTALIRLLVELTSRARRRSSAAATRRRRSRRRARLTSSARLDGRRRLARIPGGARVARRRGAARP